MGNYAAKKGRRANRAFTQLYTDMSRSQAYRHLENAELKVLMYFISEYNGSNNGSLMLTFEDVQQTLGVARATFNKAINALTDKGFIIKSRQGGKYQPNLFAVTCYPIDECLGKNGLSVHSLKPTNAPLDLWKNYNKTLAKNNN